MDVMGAGQPVCREGPLPANCTTDAMLSGAANTFCATYCVERDTYLGVAGRGGWHDPDQLLVGQTECPEAEKKYTPTSTGMKCDPIAHDEEQLQMALWAMSHAPLFISNHVPSIPASSSAILLNKAVLAINADPLGRMPFRYSVDSVTGCELWRKELVGGAVAVAVANMGDAPLPTGLGLDLLEAGFSSDTRVALHDIFEAKDLGWHSFAFETMRPIPSHGVMLLLLEYSPQYGGRADAEL